jgi:hypothetical protein
MMPDTDEIKEETILRAFSYQHSEFAILRSQPKQLVAIRTTVAAHVTRCFAQLSMASADLIQLNSDGTKHTPNLPPRAANRCSVKPKLIADG